MELRQDVQTALPPALLWKADLLFSGVKYTDALTEAVQEGAAENFWPQRKVHPDGRVEFVKIPYLFKLEGAVARVRVSPDSAYEVQRTNGDFSLWSAGRKLSTVAFVRAHAWQSFKTTDGFGHMEAGVEQLGDMLVVNLTPGCEYFFAKSHCAFCGYGRYTKRSAALGQVPGQVEPAPIALRRLGEVLACAAESGEARHVYIVGGSGLGVEQEVERYAPVIETARKAVGDRLRVTAGSGAVDRAGSVRYRDAGADSCCYNLEVWDAEKFDVVCPGKAKHVGRDRWIRGLVDAVEVFGHGNVASAFVAGVELVPPGRRMTHQEMVASIVEGADYLLSRGIMPLYSPLWPVEGTEYALCEGISAAAYLELEYEIAKLRVAKNFPVPRWLICPDCSYMLMEVDFDRALGIAAA